MKLDGIKKKYILVNDWGVSCPVLINYRHHESDEFWPEVQVLYRRTLLLSGNVLLPALQRREIRMVIVRRQFECVEGEAVDMMIRKSQFWDLVKIISCT